jgi:hypothetical protein
MDPTHPVHTRATLDGAARLLASAELPSEDLTDGHLEHFFCVGNASTPHGLIGLELHEEDALLRSLVVAPDRDLCPASSAFLVKSLTAGAR